MVFETTKGKHIIMKKVLNILVLFSAITFASCSKDDDNDPSGPSAEVATSLKQGTWSITSYSDNGVDKTADYSSFDFTFEASGAVSATNSILTATGTWKTQRDDGKHELDIEFNSPALFEPINEDWEIVSQNATQVSLKDVKDAGTETDLLVFTKN